MASSNKESQGAKPYYVERQVIRTAVVSYNVTTTKYTRDLSLELTFPEITTRKGNTFTPKLTLSGNFQRDNGNISAWGSAFRIREVFDCAGVDVKYDNSGELGADSVENLVGKEIYTLRYVAKDKNGNRTYYTWDRVGNSEEDVKQKFNESVNKGYPKNYSPELV